MRSVALSLDVLGSKTLVTALSAADGANGISCVAAHANFAVKHTSLCLGESCHVAGDKIPLFNRNHHVWVCSKARAS